MRHIGIAGVECFDGPCNPWSKSAPVCSGCAVRPMKVYQGNGNTLKTRRICFEGGYGVLISPKGCTTPEKFPYYAIDNGAFSSWMNKTEWDSDGFLAMMEKLKRRASPDFIVCPDKVAAGRESLNFSLKWLERLPEGQYYLAVQDGMGVEDVSPIIERFSGLFVGGSLDWKYATAPQWVELAHRNYKPCHIGRVGAWSKIVWAAHIGADSIDSTSWPQNDSFHHLTNAKMQQSLASNFSKED